MTPQTSTRVLHTLIVIHPILLIGSALEAMIHSKDWNPVVTTGETIILIAFGLILIAYVVSMIGLWMKKTWGLVTFGIVQAAVLLPVFNDPSLATKLSTSLDCASMLVAGLILGLVVFAMQDQFRGRSHPAQQVFA